MASINIRFPLIDDTSKNGLFTLNDVTKDAITSNLLLLLLTNKGERYYQPNYGTNLLRYVFEPKDNLTISDIEEELRETVKSFIPQINIKSISFSEEEDEFGNTVDKNGISIYIRFTYQDNTFSEEGALTISV